MTQNYFVFTPYEVYTEKQLTKEKKEELVSRGAKCMAVVFNCEDDKDFERKYFGKSLNPGRVISLQLLTIKILRIMTDGDRKFLARLVACHKRVISEECAEKRLDKSVYFKRAARCERKAKEIEESFCTRRRF